MRWHLFLLFPSSSFSFDPVEPEIFMILPNHWNNLCFFLNFETGEINSLCCIYCYSVRSRGWRGNYSEKPRTRILSHSVSTADSVGSWCDGLISCDHDITPGKGARSGPGAWASASHGRPRRSFRLLVSDWLSCDCCVHLGSLSSGWKIGLSHLSI